MIQHEVCVAEWSYAELNDRGGQDDDRSEIPSD